MTRALIWLLTIALLSLSPAFRLRVDLRRFDRESYISICGVLFQRPESMACVEVER